MSFKGSSLALCSVVFQFTLGGVFSCRTKYSHPPLNGFYCPTGLLINITTTDQQQCVHQCLIQDGCRGLSYNQRDRVCLLIDSPCDVAEADLDYMMMVFREDPSEKCDVWQSWQSNTFPSRVIETRFGAHEGLTRLQIGSDLLTGRGRPYQTVSYYPYNGTEAILEGASVLTVNPSCTLAWLPYVVGSSLPENIVKCGNFSDVPALCARHWRFTASRMFFGYYPIGDDGAYYAYWGVQRPTEFDILIEV